MKKCIKSVSGVLLYTARSLLFDQLYNVYHKRTGAALGAASAHLISGVGIAQYKPLQIQDTFVA
jgi:hypothetical protein